MRPIKGTESQVWSKKYKRYVKYWISEYKNGKYQLILHKDLLPSETEYASFGLTWKIMRFFLHKMIEIYGKAEVEKELGVKKI